MRRSSSRKAPSNQVALPAEYRADRDDGVRGKPKSRLIVSRKKGSRFKDDADDGELDDMHSSNQSWDLQCVDRWGESSPPREGGAEEARQEQALALDALPHNLPQDERWRLGARVLRQCTLFAPSSPQLRARCCARRSPPRRQPTAQPASRPRRARSARSPSTRLRRTPCRRAARRWLSRADRRR